METAMRNVSINDRATSLSPLIKPEPLPQDQPLDFSKRLPRHSLEDESLRKVSEDSAVSDLEPAEPSPPSTRPTNQIHSSVPDSSSHLPSATSRLAATISCSEPPSRLPMPSINSLLPHTTLAPGMGMFYPGAPVFPNFMPPGFPPMWPNPMAAAMIQQQQEAARKLFQNGGAKTSVSSPNQRNLHSARPPAYLNKDPLSTLGGVRGPVFPTIPTTAAMLPNTSSIVGGSVVPDPGLLAEALKSHEEMFNAYKQQVLSQKANEDSKRNHRRQVTSTTTNGNHSTPSSTQTSSSCAMEPLSETSVTVDDDISEDNSKDHTDHASQSMLSSVDEVPKYSEEILPLNGNDNSTEGAHQDHRALPTSKSQSIHSSDESIPSTSDSRRSLTPAHSISNEFLDTNGMRPRSSTLPTQSESRMLTYSPAPSNMSNGNQSSGPATPNSKGSFRKRARTLPDDQKVGGPGSYKDRRLDSDPTALKTSTYRDEAYWERRRKNNEAAKRSRDSRRAKEDEIAIRAAFLEQENLRLRVELAALRQQTAKLRSELIIIQGPADIEATTPADGS